MADGIQNLKSRKGEGGRGQHYTCKVTTASVPDKKLRWPFTLSSAAAGCAQDRHPSADSQSVLVMTSHDLFWWAAVVASQRRSGSVLPSLVAKRSPLSVALTLARTRPRRCLSLRCFLVFHAANLHLRRS